MASQPTTAQADPAPVTDKASVREVSRPYYYERALTPADLEHRSLRELSLMRNWIFARAGNPFRRAWLREFFGSQPWYRPNDRFDPGKLTAHDRANVEAIARHELSLGAASLRARRDLIGARGEQTPEERIEVTLISERLGEPSSESGGETSPLQNLRLLDERITMEQLEDFSRRDLALLRHTIFARRGQPFASEWLRLYFLNFDWYRPDPAYSDRRLTRMDRGNLKLLRGLERELGGPLSPALGELWFA